METLLMNFLTFVIYAGSALIVVGLIAIFVLSCVWVTENLGPDGFNPGGFVILIFILMFACVGPTIILVF